MILLDTAIVLWWTLNRADLSAPALAALHQADLLTISSISVWEIALKTKKGKLQLPVTPREFLARWKRMRNTSILAVTDQIWLTSVELVWSHNDPADRVIVATAQLHDASLVTSDLEMQEFYPRTIW